MSIAEYHNCTVIRRTKGGIPILPFCDIKDAILGPDYELSIVFPTLEESIELHQRWKKKDDPVNILSFPLDETSGEIFITLSKARSEASKYERSYYDHLIFLMVHGCLHLKGMVHGAKMEKQEKIYYTQFQQTLNP